jgi:hypothetical protein
MVLDENLPWSIAAELKARGYAATSNYALNSSGLKDPEWLQVVANLALPSVLLTYDNAMPVGHGPWLRSLDLTLAVIDSGNPPLNLTTEQYWRDVIHRHAHRFVSQERASWWRYRIRGGRRVG